MPGIAHIVTTETRASLRADLDHGWTQPISGVVTYLSLLVTEGACSDKACHLVTAGKCQKLHSMNLD